MALVLIVIGILMVVTGARGTYAAFGSQVVSDFTGERPFTYWIAAIGAVGALGYVDAFRGFSRLFMALILVSMVLSNQGFFAKLTASLKAGPQAPKGTTATTTTGQTIAVQTPGAQATPVPPKGIPQGGNSLGDVMGKIWEYFVVSPAH